MKHYLIMMYQEGASGLSSATRLGSNFAIERMVNDANVAAEVLFADGTNKVYICDVYGKGREIFARNKTSVAEAVNIDELSKICEKLSGAVLVGAHAQNGAENAFLSYTVNDIAWLKYRLNGVTMGDIGIAAAYLGAYGVPIVGITGDAAAVSEARAMLGDIPSAIVKTATVRNTAVCISEESARLKIAAVSRSALRFSGKPYTIHVPCNVEVTYSRTDFCDDCMMYNIGVARRVSPLVADKTVDVICEYNDLRL